MRNPVLMTLVIIVLIFFLFPLGHAHAYHFLDGNELVEAMREYEKTSDKSYFKAGKYMGYVTGVFDATRFLYTDAPNLTVGQVCAIAAKYLKEHPEKWNQPASDLVIDAFEQAFPKRR